MEPCSGILETPRERVNQLTAELTSVDVYIKSFNGIRIEIAIREVRNVTRGAISNLGTRGDH